MLAARRDPVLESMPLGYMAVDGDWRVTYVNAAGEAVVGQSWDELVGSDYWTAFPANVDNEFGRAYREVVATGRPQTIEAFYPEPLNRWFEVHAVPVPDGLTLYFSEVTAQRLAQDRLALLARVGTELTGTLDLAEAVRRIPRLVVPELGEACLLTVLDDEGRPRDLGSWHSDPARRDALTRYASVRLPGMPPTAPVVRALGGETVAADGADVLAALPDAEAHALYRELGAPSVLAVPLPGRDRVIGALTFLAGTGSSAVRVDPLTAREVAGRVGLALDNVRLFARQQQVAETLQRSLLTRPRRSPLGRIAVRYTPAAEAARVGGDWYDAFTQPGGGTTLVIGDVVGHDTAAAAAMGQLRSLLRGIAAYSDAGPAEVLRGLDTAMATLAVDTYATAAVARFQRSEEDAGTGRTRMTLSNAGHLPPLVLAPGGGPVVLPEGPGDLLLGVDPDSPRTEWTVSLDRGTTVLLFTDGLVERRTTDLDSGLARLAATARELAGRPLGVLCDELIERLVQGRPEDDVALVALRLDGRDTLG
ncbi:PAS domain S-box-containing protein [Geodermatophilus bullaregiensis]|uniref:SpoIIE family protein phosphatase n=1 Tax=Geodermatophilus bullaregiensis TaxID=1564160 RepID=UPI0027DD7B91|nr:SpoIIE family protein phosphatase [Geodermatophilus bullaregiensis]MBM7806465.1 PAS domain S-box-containing protein [Geodermatophilus bullaregiensis]